MVRFLIGVVTSGALALSGARCGPAAFGDYPKSPVVVSQLASPPGWVKVDEPQWFSAALPGEPKTTYETIGIDASRVQLKALSASDGSRVWTWVRYFEVSSLTTMLDAAALMSAGRSDFLGIRGVSFLRDEPRPEGGPTLDFVCNVAPRSPLDPSDKPMVARVRVYQRRGSTTRITFAIAVWPQAESDEAARAFFDLFRVTG